MVVHTAEELISEPVLRGGIRRKEQRLQGGEEPERKIKAIRNTGVAEVRKKTDEVLRCC